MLKSESPAPNVIVLQTQKSVVGWLMTAAAVVGILIMAFVGYKAWNEFALADRRPGFSAAGPTIIQLERLQYLVSSRVHVADVLVGESRWLRGSWIVQGDALIGVDMSKAEIKGKDGEKREAVIVLPAPIVMSPRVNHEKTQEWDVKSTSWVPLASWALGDKKNMQQMAMRESQQLVERAASSPEHMETARRDIEGTLKEFYGQVDWKVSIQWK